jgi:hypothetical protein
MLFFNVKRNNELLKVRDASCECAGETARSLKDRSKNCITIRALIRSSLMTEHETSLSSLILARLYLSNKTSKILLKPRKESPSVLLIRLQ